MTLPHCDIILPVYNSLTYVKTCLNSVLTCTTTNYNLYIINDASDNVTHHYLETQARQHAHIYLHNNRQNLGFVKSCNLGLQLSHAPYVLLLNSDVIVTPNWLERLLTCAISDPQIATINPFTNHAAQIDLPMLPGANFYDMDWALAQRQPQYPDIVTGVGFCLLINRNSLNKIGLLDEIYGHGYCEESDLCMRLTTQGFRTVLADNVYVYHQGQASFTHSLARYRHNRKIFDQRWKKVYWQQFRQFQRQNPLGTVRQAFQPPTRWYPMPLIWQTYRNWLHYWQKGNIAELLLTLLRGLKNLPTAKVTLPEGELLTKITRPNRLRVTYLLPKLVIAGGVLSVVQLVNELILLGIQARIATRFVDPAVRDWRLLTEPLLFINENDLIENFPKTDIVVATHWETANWAKILVEKGKAEKSVYYLQDYESWFFKEEEVEKRQKVIDTYQWIPNKIVTSHWLKNLLADDGFQSQIIPIGMDLDLFYPRSVQVRSSPVILAMARPGTPWRGFPYIIAALEKLKKAWPEVEIVLFGDNRLFKQKIPFIYRDEGVVSHQNYLATLYSQADVFLDGSDYQGFGRLALEAMACGTPCVLTEGGGVAEYARHEENCLLVPPRQPVAFATAILQILHSPQLQQRLTQGGLATVQNYKMQTEAEQTLEFFQQIT